MLRGVTLLDPLGLLLFGVHQLSIVRDGCVVQLARSEWCDVLQALTPPPSYLTPASSAIPGYRSLAMSALWTTSSVSRTLYSCRYCEYSKGSV